MFSPAYFMAFEHVLCALRQPDTLQDNPLSRVIITEDSPNGVPAYLQQSGGIDVGPLLRTSPAHPISWMAGRGDSLADAIGGADCTELDHSQLEAVEHCLSHKVALCLGEPDKK